MSVIDLITRVEAICKKYEKYNIDKQKEVNVSSDDAFGHLYSIFDSDLDQALQRLESVPTEKNRERLWSSMPRFDAPRLD